MFLMEATLIAELVPFGAALWLRTEVVELKYLLITACVCLLIQFLLGRFSLCSLFLPISLIQVRLWGKTAVGLLFSS